MRIRPGDVRCYADVIVIDVNAEGAQGNSARHLHAAKEHQAEVSACSECAAIGE